MIQEQLSNPFWGGTHPLHLEKPINFSDINIMDEQEKMIETVRKVLAVLEEAYPGVFREDGYTMQSTQLMGMLQQMLQTPQMPSLQPQ